MIEVPAKLEFLFQPSRYKVAYGGRGSGKSWGFARALLIQGAMAPLRVLCAREIQKSMRDSVHKLLADQVRELGLSSFYEVQNEAIRGTNGTEFVFAGLRHNVESIKSKEGLDRVWVEEAQSVSKHSWDTLIPTVRKDGSEIWITFNPELEEDETYKRFVLAPPRNTIVRKINFFDNEFFPSVLRDEMEDLKAKDEGAYLNVWEGFCRQNLEGAIYAEQLREMRKAGRVCSVPYDPAYPVHTAWDLGWADNTAIWFFQIVGMEYRCIDFMQANLKPTAWYLEQVRARGYRYGTHWLPHDARAKELGSGRSIQEQMQASGFPVEIVPNLQVLDGIQAMREIFPQTWFDAEKCADGLTCLRHYRWDIDPETGLFSKKPLHNAASHGADAARYMAVAVRKKPAPAQKITLPIYAR